MEEGELEPDPLPETSTHSTGKGEKESQICNGEDETKSASGPSSESRGADVISGEERSMQIEVDHVTENASMLDGKNEHSEIVKGLEEERRGEEEGLIESKEKIESLDERQMIEGDLGERICKVEKLEETNSGEQKERISVGCSYLLSQGPNIEMKHHVDSKVVKEDELANVYTSLEENLERLREVVVREISVDAEKREETGINHVGVQRKDRVINEVSYEAVQRQGKGNDFQAATDGETVCLSSVNEVAFGNNLTMKSVANKIKKILKDKGKSIAHSLSNVADSVECENAVEEPSCRGFELIFRDHIAQPDKDGICGYFPGRIMNKKLKLEPLDLSLGLPGVLPDQSSKPLNSQPCSPGRTRSIQSFPSSFRTTSDGFTNSISFSSSQPFVHNPSCSLTQNSMDNYEQSVGSRPIFQGVDQVSSGTIWPSQSVIEPKRKGGAGALFHRALLNGNHSQNSIQGMNGHHHLGSNALLRQPSFPRQPSPPQSVGSHDMLPEYSRDKGMLTRERSFNSPSRSEQREGEEVIVNTLSVVERIITRIVSEPLQVMERMLLDMTDHSIEYLKDSICKMLANSDKRGQIYTLQMALWRRSDLTLETMSRCPRTLLEILVALKTDLPDFLQKPNNVPSADLVDIYHNLKCRNISCRNVLPVDDCDCKICSQKNGFCSACMCLICSKFDMASNTCSWVGCDVCLHWCHTDCGLRGSHVRNGRSSPVSSGATEMQFHCVACGHPSEMFGFVKEVFKMCSKNWKAENLAKELQYVRRIFCGSNDVRGKNLYEVASQILVKLEDQKKHSDLIKTIMSFFSDVKIESESTISNAAPLYSPRETSGNKDDQRNNAEEFTTEEPAWLSAVPSSNPSREASRVLHRSTTSGPDGDRMCRQRKDTAAPQISCERKPVVDELESVVGFKQAEAKMYQERADNARREAEGLKRIAAAKNGKIDDEYSCSVAKLQLQEAEERRRRKLDELQAIERAHREFIDLKTRMEGEIKDLLLKMEDTRRNVNA
ncbi:Protein OBERON 4 [Platanthera guangdongensis]|uniref:Protein OBERON 4 n=1 Tax=Platanthera guangdongensis TaxID=2320717 RepID=A0ABR2LNE6_9ASPA